MINKKYLDYLFLFLGVIGLIIFCSFERKPASAPKSPKPSIETTKVHTPAATQTVAKNDSLKARAPASVPYVNLPSEDWQERLESSLKEQGGDSLKKIQIKKESSFIWTRDSNKILVESVVIILTDNQDEESSFRALVDPQTGKVLESWDRPISDPADVRAGFHFKLDQRYSN